MFAVVPEWPVILNCNYLIYNTISYLFLSFYLHFPNRLGDKFGDNKLSPVCALSTSKS